MQTVTGLARLRRFWRRLFFVLTTGGVGLEAFVVVVLAAVVALAIAVATADAVAVAVAVVVFVLISGESILRGEFRFLGLFFKWVSYAGRVIRLCISLNYMKTFQFNNII